MIRTATEQDLDRVLSIEKKSFEVQWSFISLRKALEDIFIVENNVAGYLIAECRQRSCYMATIKRFAVHPEQRRSGIGTALLEAGLAILMDQKIERVMLNVESSKKPAVRLYAKYGFRVTCSSFLYASVAFAMDPGASIFYTMELQMNKNNTLGSRLPLNENLKHQENAIEPPFLIEGQDGMTGTGEEILWW